MIANPAEGSRGDRLRRALLPAAFVLFVVAAYADPLFSSRSFVGRDLVPYGLPLEKAVHDAWSRGRLPVWNDDVSGGRPVLPNPNAGALYPARPLLSLLPFPAAMRWLPVLHWALAGVGLVALLGTLGSSPAARWVGAATYVFSGVVVSEVFYLAFLPGMAILPWVLWSVVRPAGSPARRAVAIGFFFGLLLLAGDVFSCAIALLAALLWIGLESAPGRRAPELATLGGGLLLAGLLGLPQVLATLLFAPETSRGVLGVSLDEALTFSLSPWRLAELVVPYPYGATWSLDASENWGRGVFRCFFASLYCGGFALVAVLSSRPRRDRGARFTRALLLTALALSVVGSFVPQGLRALESPVPLRYPEKFTLAAVFALAVAAGLGLDRFRRQKAPAWVAAVAVALALAALAARLFPDGVGALVATAVGASDAAAPAAASLPPALAEAGVLWIATWVALDGMRRQGAGVVLGATLLLTAVPLAANRRIARTALESSLYPPTAFARQISRRDPHALYRTLDESAYRSPSPLLSELSRGDPNGTDYYRRSWFLHVQKLWDRGTVFNFDADKADLSRVESLRRLAVVLSGRREGADFFAALGLRYGIRYRDQEPLPGYARFGGDAYQDFDENAGARPGLRLATRWLEAPGAQGAVQALVGLQADEILIETGRQRRGTARPGSVRILEHTPERLRLQTTADDPTWLHVARAFWSYRTIRVDGREVEPVPSLVAFTAVPVPAGRHEVDWREEAPGWEAGRVGPVLFLLAVLVILVHRNRPR